MRNQMSKRREKIKAGFLGAAVLFAAYQFFAPNTSYDQFMARKIWCTAQEGDTEPRIIELNSARGQLDLNFIRMNSGDSIRYGNLEIKAIDSRSQRSDRLPNAVGTPDQLIRLTCPGYIKVDVYHNGNLVPGGAGIEIVYAAKFLASGGLFDGWPDFSLEDVLEETDLSSREIREILKEGARIEAQKREDRYTAARAKIIAEYEQGVESNPELKREVEACKGQFHRNDRSSLFEYTVRRGDSKVKIARRFNECNGDLAFFPDQYDPLDTVYGSAVCKEHPSRDGCFDGNNSLKPGEKVYLSPGRARDLAHPKNY